MNGVFRAGAETERKEHDFDGLMAMHVRICEGIYSRYGTVPYGFTDLHGGPGWLDYEGRVFPGSPLIAIDRLSASGMPFQTWHFEKNFDTAARLGEAVAASGSSTSRVIPRPHEEGFPGLLQRTGYQRNRYGVVYSDPQKEPIPVGMLNLACSHWPRTDLIAYVSATNQYKRANANGNGHGRRLEDDVRAVRKKHVLVREPARAEQYTFFIFTDWTKFPVWENAGFHRLDSDRGRQIMLTLNYKISEAHARSNTPLWGEDDGVLPAAPAR
jgi:hypothetical protein